MKKSFILILVLSFLLFSHSFAQRRRGQVVKWFSLAAKGGVGNSLLLNSDVFKEKGAEPNAFSLSYAYGGRFTFTYGDNIGFGGEILLGGFSQKYSMKSHNLAYNKDLNFKSLDYILFFRYTGNRGGYFEIGPAFTNIKNIEETNSIQDSFFPRNDLMNTYENKYTSIMLGFGLTVVKTKRLDFNIGLRGTYGLKNIEPDANYYVLNDGVFTPSLISEKETHPISLKLLLELNYYFAFWGDASCGKGRLVFFQ